MVNVEIGFNSKSTAASIKKAMKIASELGYSESQDDKRIVIVKADGVSPKIIELLNLVGSVSKTYLKIDGEETEPVYEFKEIIGCKKKNTCKGKCSVLLTLESWNDLFKVIGFRAHNKNDYIIIDSVLRFIHDPNLVIEDAEDKITLDKSVLLAAWHDSTRLVRKFCDKFNDTDILKKFDALPDTIVVEKSEFSYENDYDLTAEDTEETEPDNNIDEIIIKIGDEFENRLRKVLKEFKGL